MNKPSSIKKKAEQWIERKDLFYWVFIVLILWLLSSDYGKDNQPFLDNWAFTSTIVSIILAVLAIVYTYAQSASSLNSTAKLEESATKIEEVSEALNKISIDNLFDKLEVKIGNLESNIDHKVQKQLENHYQKLIGPFSQKENKNLTELGDILSEDEWEFFSRKVILTDITAVGVLLMFVYFKELNNWDDKFSDFGKWLAMYFNDSELVDEYYVGHINGMISVLENLNVISVYDRNEEFSKVTINSTHLKQSLKKIAESEPSNQDILKLIQNYSNNR